MQPHISREAALADLEIEHVTHPRVFHSPDDIERARRNASETAWGARLERLVIELAEETPFVDRSADVIRSMAPIADPDGRLYVGFPFHKFETVTHGNVCPIDGTGLEMVGFDAPGDVICEDGHVFPGTVEGVEIRDDGDGWVAVEVPCDWVAAEFEGTTFRFVAEYNGWMCRAMERALEPLAYAYVLTDRDRYAETVAVLLDVLADAYRQHETLVGYAYGDHPGSRLFRPGYQVGRALKDMTNAADLVWDHEAMTAESTMRPGAPVRERVATDLVVDGAAFIWENMGKYARKFNNGTGDYNEGLAAVASLLNLDVGYAEWAFDGPVSLENFLENTVFRDGQYFETSEMYAVSFLEWAELATELKTPPYPDGVDIYDHLRFIDLNVHGPARFAMAGRLPQYGDTGWPDTDVTSGPYRGQFWKVLRYYARANDPDRRQAYAQELARIAEGDPNDRLLERTVSRDHPNDGLWPLFNLDGSIDLDIPETGAASSRGSELLPGKGFAMLRPSSGDDRGAMIRYGPTLNHGHCDELGLHFYATGRELSYDPGHKPKRHFLHSYLKQTVTHNTVVVNETSQVPPTDPGGSVAFFSHRDGYTAVELSNPAAYDHEGVDAYARTLAYIDVDDDHSYLVDLFRVGGARLETVDYSFHGGGVGFETDLAFGEAAPGSVADPTVDWGRTLRPSGEIEGFETEGHFFNAPPGNGYGFLGNPRRAPAEETWQATWRIEREGPPAAVRLTMLGATDRTVIGADAPDLLVDTLGLDPDEATLPLLLVRETDVDACEYAAVIEGCEEQFSIDRVRELPIEASERTRFSPIAIGIELTDGRTDYVVSTRDGSPVTVRTDDGWIETDAALAMVRVDDGVDVARLEDGTTLTGELAGDSFELTTMAPDGDGTIVEVQHDVATIVVDEHIQTTALDVGDYVYVDAPEYTHNSPYRVMDWSTVNGVVRIETDACDTTLGVGVIEAIHDDLLVSAANFPLTNSASRYVDEETGNTFFDGKRIRALDGPGESIVCDVDDSNRRLRVEDASGFEVGDKFVIQDVKPGDRVTIPWSASYRP